MTEETALMLIIFKISAGILGISSICLKNAKPGASHIRFSRSKKEDVKLE
jgi:hypothetical protein